MKTLICIQSFIVCYFQTKASVFRILIQSKFFGILSLKSQNNKPCLILGNGPSLNDILASSDKTLFNQFDMMAVNNAANSEQFEDLKPEMYLLNAVSYFQNDEELSDFYLKAKKSLFHSLEVKTTWPLTFIVPFRAKKSHDFQKLILANPLIKPIFFNQTPVEGLRFWSHLFYGWGWGMPRPHNVLIPGIMNAIQMGYKKIVLVGADHSWLSELSVNGKNEALLRHVHYYETENQQPMLMEDRISKPRKLHEIIHKFYLSFKGYWDISSYAKMKNVKIFNASTTSMIDAFERIELSEFKHDKL